MNQGLCVCGPRAANHICQSRRGWWGATMGGARLTLPGLYMNSISCQAELGLALPAGPGSRLFPPTPRLWAPQPRGARHAPQTGAPGSSHRPVVPVIAALEHHLGPSTQTSHPAEEAVGVGQLQVLHGAKQAVGPSPEAPMGRGLHVGVRHLDTGRQRLSNDLPALSRPPTPAPREYSPG